MRDQIDLCRWRFVSLLQHPSPQFGHDYHPGRERNELLHNAALVGSRFTQDGMQRGDNRHSQSVQECQNMGAGGPTENAEFVLQADDVNVADVEEVRGAQIGRQVLLLNLEPNHLRVLVATRYVVDRHCQALALRMRALHGGKQVGCERCDAALARQMIADESNLLDFGGFFREAVSISISISMRSHVILSARTINLLGAAPTK